MRADQRDYLKAIEAEKKWDDAMAERTRKLIERFNRQFGVEGTPPAEETEESEAPTKDETAAEQPKAKRARKKAAK
jgi:hypothetical protein